jgi:L-ascorbate metabolism protein UlaG (beta-lactamase superfamily)
MRFEEATVHRYPLNSASRTGQRLLACGSRMRAFLAGFVCFVLICLPGCSGPSTGLPVYIGGAELPPGDPAYQTEVQIKYLGAGGVMIRRGADVLLTAPFFSNPSILRVAFGEIAARPDQIDHFLGSTGGSIADATAVLVGHAHYDHLMDVPYIKKIYLPQATIYGSETMRNTLAGDRTLSTDDVVSVEEKKEDVGTAERPGKWWPAGPRLRFMALRSEHAPIIAHLKFFEGNYTEPLKELPTRAFGWREGQTLAYLIDFMSADRKTVEFRIHYQDAASNEPLGFPPSSFADPADDRPVDLAIVCMPGFDQVKDYPEAIVKRLKPRFVVIIHWENFFELLPDDPKDLRTVPTEDAQRFLARLQAVFPEADRVKLPAPGAWMRFAPRSGND